MQPERNADTGLTRGLGGPGDAVSGATEGVWRG
jgi:hypothetical protein